MVQKLYNIKTKEIEEFETLEKANEFIVMEKYEDAFSIEHSDWKQMKPI